MNIEEEVKYRIENLQSIFKKAGYYICTKTYKVTIDTYDFTSMQGTCYTKGPVYFTSYKEAINYLIDHNLTPANGFKYNSYRSKDKSEYCDCDVVGRIKIIYNEVNSIDESIN